MKTAYFVGNSNNEPARIAYELSKVVVNPITLILIQPGKLNDPKELPYFRDFEQRIRILDLTPKDFGPFGMFTLFFNVNRIIQKDSVVIMNSFAPALVFKKQIKKIFFSTGTDVTSFANWKWASIDTKNDSYLIKLANFFLALCKSFFVFLQRRSISSAVGIVAPKNTRDPLYDSVISTLYDTSKKRFSFQFAQKLNILKSCTMPSNNPCIRVLVGCRLDDGLDYVEKHRSNFNDKNPSAIYAALKNFKTDLKIEFFFILKGNWALRFQELEKISTENITYQAWDEMGYSEFYKLMNSSDIIIDSVGPSIPGRISIDALALGKFLIVNSMDFDLKQHFNPHIYHATNADEVSKSLVRLLSGDLRKHRELCEHNINDSALFFSEEYISFLTFLRSLM